MVAIVSLLVALALSLLVTRVATMALMLTGLSREAARFQARSAFTGAGFTTNESEAIVNHPVRRQIVMLLMLLGNIGVATVVATMMISMLQATRSEHWGWSLLILLVGLTGLWFAASSRWVERQLNRIISHFLRKWTQLDLRDYIALLQLQRGFAVTELRIEEQDWLAGKTLAEMALPKEGVLVLGVERQGGIYLGAPTGDTEIFPDDVLVLYGPIHRLEELDRRRSGRRGEKAHQAAVDEHKEVLVEQEELEQATAPDDDPAHDDQ